MWSRGVLVLVVLAVLGVSRTAAQTSPPEPDRRYPLPTYDEDWRFLRDPNLRAEPWDRVKYVPLADGIFASFGGEARETYERFGNENFGLSLPSPNGYLLQRYLLHSDVHVGSRFRLWAELNSSLEDGRVGGPRPVTDEDKLDLHQAFVEFKISQRSDSPVRIEIGRQEIAVGSGRMYALREGPNVPLSFDGVRAIAKTASWRFDAWAARPVTTTPGIFDDASNRQFSVWGTYATRTGIRHASVGVYYLGLDRQNASFDKGAANELRHTVGARVWRAGLWAYDAEGMYQFGSFGAGNIRAWRVAVEGSRGLAVSGNPRVGIEFDIASGDRDRSSPNLGTFNSFFQSGTYSGRAPLLGPDNTIRLEPTLTLAPRRGVSLSTGWVFFWRESEQDGLYGIGGNLIVPSNGVLRHYEGNRPIVEAGWVLNPHLSVHLSYIFVFNGQFEEQSVHATTTESYVSPWITYRF
jgi:Alginate export